jgi:hypothetical protein
MGQQPLRPLGVSNRPVEGEKVVVEEAETAMTMTQKEKEEEEVVVPDQPEEEEEAAAEAVEEEEEAVEAEEVLLGEALANPQTMDPIQTQSQM